MLSFTLEMLKEVDPGVHFPPCAHRHFMNVENLECDIEVDCGGLVLASVGRRSRYAQWMGVGNFQISINACFLSLSQPFLKTEVAESTEKGAGVSR
jgi:hypothetical protein